MNAQKNEKIQLENEDDNEEDDLAAVSAAKSGQKKIEFFEEKACTLVFLGYYRLTGKVS